MFADQNQNTSFEHDITPKIAVIGVGGAGCNAVNNMIASKLSGVDFFALNTDSQALKHSLAPNRIQLGTHATRGLGAGSKPDVGRAAAEESLSEVMAELEGANMVFITAGMGGGTGTGAAPVVAKACKDAGVLTVGVVTKPFHFEGAHRMRTAEKGIEEMQDLVDTLIVIPNQNLFRVANEKTTFADAFRMADGVLQSGVRGITDLMVRPGMVNLDFADIRTAMIEWMGKAMMGTGEANGDRRAIEAAERAINNPLLDDISMKGAKGVVINITGGYDMTLFEVDEACNRIRDEVDPDANIIFGTSFDEELEGTMRVTILATGIESNAVRKTRPSSTTSATSPVSGISYAPQSNVARAAVPMSPELVVPKQGPLTMQTVERTGGRMAGAFIPPKPVEAFEPAQQTAYVMPEQADLNLSFPAPVEQTVHEYQNPAVSVVTPLPSAAAPEEPRAGHLKLTPPVPGRSAAMAAAVKAKKKSMSLFDRFSTLFGGHEEDELATQASQPAAASAHAAAPSMQGPAALQPSSYPQTTGYQAPAALSAPQFGGAHQAVANLPTAPTANTGFAGDPFGINTPAMGQTHVTPQGSVLAAKAEEQAHAQPNSDLDIPAFLRRQIS